MDYGTAGYAAAVVFLAGIVRGFSGFGFSLLAITALSLVFRPVDVIASIFLLELAASAHLLPGAWRAIAWRPVILLLIGCAVATPLGVLLLRSVPVDAMRLALGAFVLATTGVLWRGYTLRTEPGPVATTATGAAAGLLNGAFGIGGPPVILFFLSTPSGRAAGRASLIAFFLGTDVIGLGFQLRDGLITEAHLWRAAIMLPALVLGVALGARSFRGTDPAVFRRYVLGIMALLAVLTGLQGAIGMSN